MKEEVNGNSYKPFALLFNSYAKGFVRKTGHLGKVFQFKLKRIEIRREAVLCNMMRYINQNPRKHGVVSNCEWYRYSSFRASICPHPTLIAKQEIQQKFGSYETLKKLLNEPVDVKGMKMYLLEE